MQEIEVAKVENTRDEDSGTADVRTKVAMIKNAKTKEVKV